MWRAIKWRRREEEARLSLTRYLKRKSAKASLKAWEREWRPCRKHEIWNWLMTCENGEEKMQKAKHEEENRKQKKLWRRKPRMKRMASWREISPEVIFRRENEEEIFEGLLGCDSLFPDTSLKCLLLFWSICPWRRSSPVPSQSLKRRLERRNLLKSCRSSAGNPVHSISEERLFSLCQNFENGYSLWEKSLSREKRISSGDTISEGWPWHAIWWLKRKWPAQPELRESWKHRRGWSLKQALPWKQANVERRKEEEKMRENIMKK